MRFEQAFKEARNSGDKTFEFEGKSYSTRMAGEGKSAEKPIPTPPKRDVPREDDPEKPAPPAEAAIPTPMRRPSGNAGEAPIGRRSPFERMPNPYEAESPDAVQGPEKPPTTGRLRTFGGKMAEENAGYPINPSDETGYRKGGMVKKKSGGMTKKSGGSVRGAGIAQRGQGKMRMC
jgi:hypothetical protein